MNKIKLNKIESNKKRYNKIIRIKQAGAELCQAQVKLEVVVEVVIGLVTAEILLIMTNVFRT